MKHYEIGHWVDYARGLVSSETRLEMRRHVESGCRKCGELSEFTARLSATYARMAEVVVPEPAVRLARAVFPVREAEKPKRGSLLPIELIFDSFLTPCPAGQRDRGPAGWQGLYRAGDCSVDLRIEPSPQSARAAVVGQIASHTAPVRRMGNLRVRLTAGRVVVAQTLSNRFGEFQMEYDQTLQPKLRIDLENSESIQLPLKRILSRQPAAMTLTSRRKFKKDTYHVV